MKIFGIQIFPRKFKVTVTMHSGSSFYFYCDTYDYTPGSSISFSGGTRLNGSKLPGKNIMFIVDRVESVQHDVVRLYRIYKA